MDEEKTAKQNPCKAQEELGGKAAICPALEQGWRAPIDTPGQAGQPWEASRRGDPQRDGKEEWDRVDAAQMTEISQSRMPTIWTRRATTSWWRVGTSLPKVLRL